VTSATECRCRRLQVKSGMVRQRQWSTAVEGARDVTEWACFSTSFLLTGERPGTRALLAGWMIVWGMAAGWGMVLWYIDARRVCLQRGAGSLPASQPASRLTAPLLLPMPACPLPLQATCWLPM
jgi:hypothetical protein